MDEVLASLDDEFEAMYSAIGRPSVPPEQLLKATVLMALYSVRSERAFCERLNYDLLFKWFLDLAIDAPAFDPTTFTKNRERLLEAEIADRFFAAVVAQAKLRRYTSSEHFSVDGTLLEAWASHKSFTPRQGPPPATRPSGRNGEVDFRGQPRSNRTHSSTTDPEALLARKSNAAPAKLSFAGHVLMENRSALIVDMELTAADGYAEREAATQMLGRLPKRKRRRTVAADKAYDTAEFVAQCRTLGITPHVAQNTSNRRSAIDARTTRHPRPPDQPADPPAHRRAVRLDQDDRRRPQAPLQRSKAQPRVVPDRRSRLQHAADRRPRRPPHVNGTPEADNPATKQAPSTG